MAVALPRRRPTSGGPHQRRTPPAADPTQWPISLVTRVHPPQGRAGGDSAPPHSAGNSCQLRQTGRQSRLIIRKKCEFRRLQQPESSFLAQEQWRQLKSEGRRIMIHPGAGVGG
ncbi:hypothetical protein Ga0074812_1364 [Parafrankia irregularis]|uniref:Uncharacterized protein n=1 Tax=Parafrankia irregularis TaxID=795642 RepID=A0A0S4QWU3_9ACTN|nr:hypothetical protein Ga0074812_1364 [Parafrankia irregularis]